MAIELSQTATAESRGEAWLQSVERLLDDPSGEAFNFIVEVQNPSQSTARGRLIEDEVDEFLRVHDSWPLQTVAETLFPASEYRRDGVAGVYGYPEEVYPHIRDQHTNSWGTYAHRLTRRELPDGQTMNPLEACVEKMKVELGRKSLVRVRYEIDVLDTAFDLSTHDVTRDSKGRFGDIPCLSHLSFKIADRERLLLAATFRNHYYIERLPGNLLGLSQLQQFVADETGLTSGPLVCLSTLAQIDTKRWRRSEVKELVSRCNAIPEDTP